MTNKKYYDITGLQIERETEKAILVGSSWFPISQVVILQHTCKDCGNHDRKVCLTLIPAWLANKNELPFAHTYDIETWKTSLEGESDNEYLVRGYNETV